MPKAKNIKPLLLTLANSAKAENKKKIQELIGLWEDRKIPNYKTVQNLALKLASSHKATLKSAEKEYQEFKDKYKTKPSMTGRLKNKTTVITLTDTIGDLTRPKAHILINIVTNRYDDKGNEKIGRTFGWALLVSRPVIEGLDL